MNKIILAKSKVRREVNVAGEVGGRTVAKHGKRLLIRSDVENKTPLIGTRIATEHIRFVQNYSKKGNA